MGMMGTRMLMGRSDKGRSVASSSAAAAWHVSAGFGRKESTQHAFRHGKHIQTWETGYMTAQAIYPRWKHRLDT
eukprot:2152416-Rhodomonas_salina.1